MKKTSKENIEISDLIADSLGINFRNTEYSLGKWGEVDNWAMLPNGTILLLECEKGQKHPNTNVLKLYPFLEENSDKTIVLIHYFYPENKATKNRLALCDFLGDKMEKLFLGRFQYYSLKCKPKEISDTFTKHQEGLINDLLERNSK